MQRSGSTLELGGVHKVMSYILQQRWCRIQGSRRMQTPNLTTWLNANVGQQSIRNVHNNRTVFYEIKNVSLKLCGATFPHFLTCISNKDNLPIVSLFIVYWLLVSIVIASWQVARYNLLLRLFVSDNYISDIEQFDLKSLSSSLKTLILAGNSLTSVPEGRAHLRKLNIARPLIKSSTFDIKVRLNIHKVSVTKTLCTN